MGNEDVKSASVELMRLLTEYRISQALYVVARLGIADRIAEGPKDADTLAREVGAQPGPLFRTLRALVAVGVFSLDSSGRFALTPVGELLRSDVPDSLAASAIFQGEEPYRAFGDLLHTVRTGETAFDHMFGAGHFEYMAAHPEAGTTFNAAMVTSAQHSGLLVDSYDLSRHRVLVDVGGGRGHLLGSVLAANPGLRGILYDLPAMEPEAKAHLASVGVADRCEIRTGSAFESIPSGGDAYLMSRLLHDFPDEKAGLLLRNCRKAMGPDGVLLLREGVLPEGAIPPNRASVDLMMMVMTGGRERTEADWRRLLSEAGFSLVRIHRGEGNQDLLEARPI